MKWPRGIKNNHWLNDECWGDARVIGEAGRILGVGAEAHSVVPRLLSPLKTDRSAIIKYRKHLAHDLPSVQTDCRRASKDSKFSVDVEGKTADARKPKPRLLQATGTLLLHVGFDTKFDSALKCEDSGCRSHKLLQKAAWEGHLHMPKNDFAELEAEVLTGLCTLQYDAEGEIERVVPVEVLHLAREDGRVYARIGAWERMHHSDAKWKQLKSAIELPGKKRRHNEDPYEVLGQVIMDELPQWSKSTLAMSGEPRKEVFTGASASFGMHTRYTRTVHMASLKNLPVISTSDILIPSILRGGDKIVLHSWLEETELKAAKSKEAKELMAVWMADFQTRLEETLNNVASATRGRRRDDCVRKLIYLNWWRGGKQNHLNTQQRGEAWDVASRAVDEACINGETQEQLIAEYDAQFVRLAVDEILSDLSFARSFEDILLSRRNSASTF